MLLSKYLNSKKKFKLKSKINFRDGRSSEDRTLTDLDSSCPGSLLKTTPTPQGYPWISWGWYVTPEPRFSGLVLEHQGLEELELKHYPKTAVFDQIWLFLSGFWFWFF